MLAENLILLKIKLVAFFESSHSEVLLEIAVSKKQVEFLKNNEVIINPFHIYFEGQYEEHLAFLVEHVIMAAYETRASYDCIRQIKKILFL